MFSCVVFSCLVLSGLVLCLVLSCRGLELVSSCLMSWRVVLCCLVSSSLVLSGVGLSGVVLYPVFSCAKNESLTSGKIKHIPHVTSRSSFYVGPGKMDEADRTGLFEQSLQWFNSNNNFTFKYARVGTYPLISTYYIHCHLNMNDARVGIVASCEFIHIIYTVTWVVTSNNYVTFKYARVMLPCLISSSLFSS